MDNRLIFLYQIAKVMTYGVTEKANYGPLLEWGSSIKEVTLANPGNITLRCDVTGFRFCSVVMLRFLEKLLWHDVICSY